MKHVDFNQVLEKIKSKAAVISPQVVDFVKKGERKIQEVAHSEKAQHAFHKFNETVNKFLKKCGKSAGDPPPQA